MVAVRPYVDVHFELRWIPGRDLLAERRDRRRERERAERLEQLTRRPHRTGDDHRALDLVRGLPGELGGSPRQFGNTGFEPVELQPLPVAPEAVREDHVGTGGHEVTMQREDARGLVDVPDFRGHACFQAGVEVIRARRAVGEEHAAATEQIGKRGAHVRGSFDSSNRELGRGCY